MSLKHALAASLLGIALVLAGTVLAGCGGDAAGESNQPQAESGQGQAEGGQGQVEGSREQAAEGGQPKPERGQPKPEDSQAYQGLLRGLQKAALAEQTFHAARKANSLDAGQKAALKSFCNFAWQIVVNGEQAKLGKTQYVAGRITTYAEYNLSPSDYPSTEAAVRELESVIDLSKLDAGLTRSYSKACYQ
jgi:hypothetical protein